MDAGHLALQGSFKDYRLIHSTLTNMVNLSSGQAGCADLGCGDKLRTIPRQREAACQEIDRFGRGADERAKQKPCQKRKALSETLV